MRRVLSLAILLALSTLALGLAYPLLVTGYARLCFPWQAAGSLLYRGDTPVGSALVGQQFRDPARFHGRPSATLDHPTDGGASAASNLGPSNPLLRERVRSAVRGLRDAGTAGPLPADLVTASASGLDPHISPQAALCQIPRIARLRGLDPAVLEELVARHTASRRPWLFGEDRVTVLQLNLALEALSTR